MDEAAPCNNFKPHIEVVPQNDLIFVRKFADLLVENLVNLISLVIALALWISDLDICEHFSDAQPKLTEYFPNVAVIEEPFGAAVSEHLAENIEKLFFWRETQLRHEVFVLFCDEIAQLLLYLFQLLHEVGSLRFNKEHLVR